MAYENSAFVATALIRSNSSLTRDVQNFFNTDFLVALAPALIWACCGQALPVFPSNSIFFSSHSSVLIGGTLYSWPPITCAGSSWKTTNHDLKANAAQAPATKFSDDLSSKPYSTAEETHCLQLISTDFPQTRSKLPVRTLAPATSAAQAIQVFGGKAILLLPFPSPRTAFQCSPETFVP